MNRLPLCRARDLGTDTPPPRRWLVESLWAERAVGILGGEPKCGKSLLALDLAVAVAAGTPCLRRFDVAERGRVLLYAAEDSLAVVRERLEGIVAAAGTRLGALDLFVITAPTLRLDTATDQDRLEETVRSARPRLLVLDPFVRLHAIDENLAGDVAPLLGYLRRLERLYACAVLLVHHVRKGAASLRPGQALRGSSELHAWGDSNLYLRRRADTLRLSVEHRAAAGFDDLFLRLPEPGHPLALAIVDDPPAAEPADTPSTTVTAHQRVYAALAAAAAPLALAELRQACRIRTSTLCSILNTLTAEGTIRKTSAGYAAVR
ncbi:MAG: AAA family ATPase [Burkholderiales bacterium]